MHARLKCFANGRGVSDAGSGLHPNRGSRVFSTYMTEKKMSKRELIDTGTDKRYVRRDAKGRFKESDDVGRSLSQDVRKSAKASVKSGQGDRGDRKH